MLLTSVYAESGWPYSTFTLAASADWHCGPSQSKQVPVLFAEPDPPT